MQYLKPNVCKQLEAMGLVSESGMWWVADSYFDAAQMDWRDEPVTKDFAFKNWQSEGKRRQAFTISDILLNADNARKLWGEATTGWVANPEEKEWQYQSHRLLDLVLSGTDIEPELQKAIESKPL